MTSTPHCENYKYFSNFELRFTQITLLVGLNSAKCDGVIRKTKETWVAMIIWKHIVTKVQNMENRICMEDRTLWMELLLKFGENILLPGQTQKTKNSKNASCPQTIKQLKFKWMNKKKMDYMCKYLNVLLIKQHGKLGTFNQCH